ncbi:hypothetical protein GQX74_005340 [Glossina fuscipes]|nr:hypothetical protein GQX74_005340 [Glossina fuscipes]
MDVPYVMCSSFTRKCLMLLRNRLHNTNELLYLRLGRAKLFDHLERCTDDLERADVYLCMYVSSTKSTHQRVKRQQSILVCAAVGADSQAILVTVILTIAIRFECMQPEEI